jgi:hypothetical protein
MQSLKEVISTFEIEKFSENFRVKEFENKVNTIL